MPHWLTVTPRQLCSMTLPPWWPLLPGPWLSSSLWFLGSALQMALFPCGVKPWLSWGWTEAPHFNFHNVKHICHWVPVSHCSQMDLFKMFLSDAPDLGVLYPQPIPCLTTPCTLSTLSSTTLENSSSTCCLCHRAFAHTVLSASFYFI